MDTTRSKRKGSYLLLLYLAYGREIEVGKLGVHHFPAGLYCYAGSGQASLDARVGRHFSKEKKRHWHIDHLLDHAEPFSAILVEDLFVECQIGMILAATPGSQIVCPGFGSSDCSCPTHLFLVDVSHLPAILNEVLWLSEHRS